MDNWSASQHWHHGLDPHMGHDHNSSYDTSTGWFQLEHSIYVRYLVPGSGLESDLNLVPGSGLESDLNKL